MSIAAPTSTPAPRQQPRFLPEPGPWALALVLLLTAALLVLAYWLLDPTPAKRIVVATGPEQGAYAEFAKRYVPLLQAQGVKLELRPTQGSAENLALLRDPRSGVHAAFVQGGVEPPDRDNPEPTLVTLGSVAYEPLWLFYREDSAQRLLAGKPLTRLNQLGNWRINSGPAGAGTGPMFRQIAALGGVPAQTLHRGGAGTVNGVVSLVQGQDDALAMVAAPEAPFVQYLLHTPGVQLFEFEQAEAYVRRLGFLHPLRMPRGLIDPAADRPAKEVRMIATTASLVVREDLHPALVQLLVQAAVKVHSQAGWFSRQGEFPNLQAPIFPVSPEAERFYRSGPPWLQRYLPFWLANFFDRMWIVLLPLLAVLLPASRFLPPIVELRLRSRVFRWYGQLRQLELAAGQRAPDQLKQELDQIEAHVAGIKVPLSYADELYALRTHIAMIRRKLETTPMGMAATVTTTEAPPPSAPAASQSGAADPSPGR